MLIFIVDLVARVINRCECYIILRVKSRYSILSLSFNIVDFRFLLFRFAANRFTLLFDAVTFLFFSYYKIFIFLSLRNYKFLIFAS